MFLFYDQTNLSAPLKLQVTSNDDFLSMDWYAVSAFKHHKIKELIRLTFLTQGREALAGYLQTWGYA